MKLFPIAISLALFSFSHLASAELRQACFKIEGMTCDSCAKGITSILTKQKGIKSAETSFPKKSSLVNYQSKDTTPAEIKKFIELAGYQATDQACKSATPPTKSKK